MGWIEEQKQRATEAFELDRLKSVYGTTRNYVVGIEAAEVLSEFFPVFSVSEVRECLQWEPVRRAIALLAWAAGKDNPCEALKDWAQDKEAGYYRPGGLRPVEDDDAYFEYLARKEVESFRARRSGLSASEVQDLTVEFYAPSMKAEANRVLRAGADGGVA